MSQQQGQQGHWQLESSGYDRARFYTKAADSKGHRESLNVKVSPDMAAFGSQLIQGGRIAEYKTMGDFVRDALQHRSHDLEAMGFLTTKQMSMLRFEQLAIIEIEERERRMQFSEYAERLGKMIDELLDSGPAGVTEAKALVQHTINLLEEVQGQEFWRQKYMELLLKHAKRVILLLPKELVS